MASHLLSNKANDARAAMAALIEARSLPIREGEPEFPRALAQLSYAIADAMAEEHARRAQGASK